MVSGGLYWVPLFRETIFGDSPCMFGGSSVIVMIGKGQTQVVPDRVFITPLRATMKCWYGEGVGIRLRT